MDSAVTGLLLSSDWSRSAEGAKSPIGVAFPIPSPLFEPRVGFTVLHYPSKNGFVGTRMLRSTMYCNAMASCLSALGGPPAAGLRRGSIRLRGKRLDQEPHGDIRGRHAVGSRLARAEDTCTGMC